MFSAAILSFNLILTEKKINNKGSHWVYLWINQRKWLELEAIFFFLSVQLSTPHIGRWHAQKWRIEGPISGRHSHVLLSKLSKRNLLLKIFVRWKIFFYLVHYCINLINDCFFFLFISSSTNDLLIINQYKFQKDILSNGS